MMEAALAELKAAQASREAPAAKLGELQEQYAELGSKAAHAGTEPERTALLQEQYHVQNAQAPFVKAVAAADARIRAARLAVGESA
jgi:hypothetical protein